MKQEDRKVQNMIFYRAKLFGNDILFIDVRIDKDSLPEGLYCYDIRHSDSDFDEPITVEPFVLVNWYGTIISKTPVDFSRAISPDDLYLQIRKGDFRIEWTEELLLERWLEHIPTQKRHEPER